MDRGIIINEAISILVVFLLYGIYTCVTALSIYFLLRSLGSQSRKLLLLVIVTMFLVQTCLMTELSICFLNDIKSISQAVNGRIILRAQTAVAVLARANYFLSDVVVVWRAWSLSRRGSSPSLKYSRYILGICLLASFVALLVDGVLNVAERLSNQNTQKNALALSSIGSAEQQLGKKRIALPLILFLTNVVATGFIGITFWDVHRATRNQFGHCRQVANLVQILLFMFESGLAYSSVWIVMIVAMIRPFSKEVTTTIVVLLPQITAIYPALVIMLSAMQRPFSKASVGDDIAIPSARTGEFPDILTTRIQIDTIDVQFQKDLPMKETVTV
ncbi:hypothetical protein BT96DRAFT_980998 [Gymnopus androsaceus JB14]|uniref:Uncharacterized protein n=1 Tax=Gymnopus androsaceus JB14 TaxID=1447944 RepID=A0A6A4GTR5_9AGAR|nr:hypothetical protein BT96DRAFT_980998 [Gymnopus androsaceus JB14]